MKESLGIFYISAMLQRIWPFLEFLHLAELQNVLKMKSDVGFV